MCNMSERRSLQTSRPQNYKDFSETGAMSEESGEHLDLTLQPPDRDSDIDGPNKSAKKTHKKESTRDRSSSQVKNPSVNQIPSGTVSATLRNLQPEVIADPSSGAGDRAIIVKFRLLKATQVHVYLKCKQSVKRNQTSAWLPMTIHLRAQGAI